MNRRILTMSLAASVAAMVASVSCASPPEEETGRASSAIVMPPCGTKLSEVDGVWAYSNGVNEATGLSCGGRTALGTLRYQCVEFAQRYMHERFGIQAVWPVAVAAEMCTKNPAGTTVHWVGDGYAPKHGDLAVWTVHQYGHVAVVRTPRSDGIEIVEQNGGWSTKGTRVLYGSPSAGFGGVACFVSADANTGTNTGTSAPASDARAGTKCGYGDGLYCGGNGGGDDRGTLYRCAGGEASPVRTCAMGCEWLPFPDNDRCRTQASCPYGAGRYCGGNGISGDSSVLFDCQAGRITAVERCARGCQRNANGMNDTCAP